MNTLLDRANDAINTIIRLDETTETGEYLQPCIEGIHILNIRYSEFFLAQINEGTLVLFCSCFAFRLHAKKSFKKPKEHKPQMLS